VLDDEEIAENIKTNNNDNDLNEEENKLLHLVTTYENFHASEEGRLKTSHGKKVKNGKKEKNNKGSGRSAGVVKAAGLKSQLKSRKASLAEKTNGIKAKATTAKAAALHSKQSSPPASDQG
jgi:hypothetical protein